MLNIFYYLGRFCVRIWLSNDLLQHSILLYFKTKLILFKQGAYGPYSPDECISLPVYTSAERDRVVINIDIPCGGSQDQWIQCGAALFLKNQ